MDGLGRFFIGVVWLGGFVTGIFASLVAANATGVVKIQTNKIQQLENNQ